MESNIQKPSVSVPVIIWHLQEDSEQKLNCFTLGRDDRHVGPRSQIEGLCDIALGFKNYALDSISELRKEGRWQPLPEGLELEENMKMVRNPLSTWTQPPAETHHLPRPLSIHQSSITGPEKTDCAYLDFQNATAFRMLFNIDTDTTMNAKKNIVHGFISLNPTVSWVLGFISLLIKTSVETSEIVSALNYFWNP